MSTEGPVDPNLIEQTKQQIRSLVAEIAQLAKEDISPEEFYGGFLTRVVSALAAVGGAVWTTNDEGRLALQYQINIQETNLRESEEANAQHSRLLYKVLADGEPVILPPHSGGGEGEAGNPTDYLILLGLLKTDLETGGIVEVFQRTDSGIATQKGYLRLLMQMCELAGDYLKSHQLRHFSDRQSLWTQLEDFARVVHASLDPRETAFTIANEGRRLIECDRLSVAIRKGNKCYVESISGQDVFDKRSNLVRLMNRLASAVVATGDPVWYTGDTRDMAPQVESAVEEYVDEAHSKTVAILPLKRPEPPEEDDPKKKPEPQPVIGALIVEQIEDSRVAQSMLSRVDVVCKHSSAALANSMEHQSLFLMPVWRAIGHSRWVVKGRTLPKTISISLAVIAVILFLCLYQTDFQVEAKGTLEPVERRDVFSPNDRSVVKDLLVNTDAHVKEGQLLVRLHGPEVNLKLEEVIGKLAAAERSYNAKFSDINNGALREEEKARRLSEIAELEESIIGLKTQRGILELKQKELEVLSPIEGTVITYHLEERLRGRPLQLGTSMMRIVDLSKEWQLELHMPDQRVGFVVKAQQELYGKMRAELKKLLLQQKRAESPNVSAEAATSNAVVPQADSAVNSALAPTGVPPQVPESSPAPSGDSPPPSANNPADAPATEVPAIDPLEAEVDAELAKIPDERLHDRWSQWAKGKFDAELREKFKDETDEAVKAKLDEVLRQSNYEIAWETLAAWKSTEENAEVKKILSAVEPLKFLDDENVTFILGSESTTTLKGRIKEISKSAEVRSDEGNTVLIKVAIDKSQIPNLVPGAGVTAKIKCGRTSLGYAWLHEVFTFIQTKIIFRYF
jgi:multidrug efflux pump subunit AcrA (membrane-fusion protein)